MSRYSVFLGILLVGIVVTAGCDREQQKPTPPARTAKREMPAATFVLATIPKGVHDRNISQLVFSESGCGTAYIVWKNGTYAVVHNGKEGKEYNVTISDMVLSTDGQHVAYGALVGEKWHMVVDGREGKAYDSIAAPVFDPNGMQVAYLAKSGDLWHVAVGDKQSEGTRTSYTKPLFNSDSSLIAYVEDQRRKRTKGLTITDVNFRRKNFKPGVGELLVSNRERTRLAATQYVGSKVRVIDFSFSDPDDVREGRIYDAVSDLTFGDDGQSLAYVAEKNGARMLVLNGAEITMPEGNVLEWPVIRSDGRGAGILLDAPDGHVLYLASQDNAEKGKSYDETANLVYSTAGQFFAFAARKGDKWFVVVNGKEGPHYDRVVAPIVSPDGKRLVYRARAGGKRFVVVADADARTIRQHRAYEQVFQPEISPDGRSVVYGVKEGDKLICTVERL